MNEIIDGFVVTDGRKKLWDVELEILEVIENICLQNNLNYFLLGGSAIGAVRHKGFIPWDDDIDIGMLREDFEKFIVAFNSMEFSDLVMEYYHDNSEYSSTFMRIRKKNTTAIVFDQLNVSREHGVFVEIYPFDKVPNNKRLRRLQIKFSRVFKIELDYNFEKIELSVRDKKRHDIFSMFSINTIWKIWNFICRYYNSKPKSKVDTVCLPYYASKGINFFNIDDVKSSEYVDFSGHKVRIAVGYDKCLKQTYGNYMELPALEERGKHHGVKVFFDADTPWQVYFGDKKDILDRFFAGDYTLCNIWESDSEKP